MKFNTTYTRKISKLKTIKEIELLKNALITFFTKKFNLTNIDTPIYFNEDSSLRMTTNGLTRNVTFDISGEYRVASLALSPTNWMRKFIVENNLKIDEGLWTQTTSIWRDVSESPVSSIQRTELTFMFVLKEANPKIISELSQDFYEFVQKYSMKIKKKYDLLYEYPSFAEYMTSQQLEYLMPNQTFKIRELEILNEKKAYFLMRPGERLYSGMVHTYIPPTHYDLKLFNQLLMKDFINSSTLRVASIGVIATGDELDKQLKQALMLDELSSDFISNQIKYKENKIVEVKINIPRLVMALLNKGYIGEVQSGVYNSESSIIKKKYKVEIL